MGQKGDDMNRYKVLGCNGTQLHREVRDWHLGQTGTESTGVWKLPVNKTSYKECNLNGLQKSYKLIPIRNNPSYGVSTTHEESRTIVLHGLQLYTKMTTTIRTIEPISR